MQTELALEKRVKFPEVREKINKSFNGGRIPTPGKEEKKKRQKKLRKILLKQIEEKRGIFIK